MPSALSPYPASPDPSMTRVNRWPQRVALGKAKHPCRSISPGRRTASRRQTPHFDQAFLPTHPPSPSPPVMRTPTKPICRGFLPSLPLRREGTRACHDTRMDQLPGGSLISSLKFPLLFLTPTPPPALPPYPVFSTRRRIHPTRITVQGTARTASIDSRKNRGLYSGLRSGGVELYRVSLRPGVREVG